VRVGIIGSGTLVDSLAHRWRAAGHSVRTVSGPGDEASSGNDSTTTAAEEAALQADAVVLALPLHMALSLPHQPFIGRIVADATGYFDPAVGAFPDIDAGRTTSGEMLADHLPGAAVVQIFNVADLLTVAEPSGGTVARPRIPISSDETSAAVAVAELLADLGLDAVPIGRLADGRRPRTEGGPLLTTPKINPDDARIRIVDD
jgi:predicted dinucleotide-binding enzyme